MNIVIIGANRGIGLGFVKHYLNKHTNVWASYRHTPGALTDLRQSNLHTFQWDVSCDYTAQDVRKKSLPKHIDILINNAGIYGPKKGGQSLESVTREGLHEVFDIDCVGAIMTTQLLKNNVTDAVINISSKMGSSSDNNSGGTYAYRAAKAALIIASKSMAIDLKPYGIQVLTLHPGWVRTDMTGHSGLIDIEESVHGMTRVIEHCRDYAPGDFIAFDGARIAY